MKRSNNSTYLHPRTKQRGIATVLLTILVGVAVTATAFGMMYSMRSTQEKQVAVHAKTHAQNSVWLGVEAFRRYLDGLSDTEINALHNTGNVINIGVDASYGNITASNVQVSTVSSKLRINADIKAVHNDARASAAVGVVFEVTDDSGCTDCFVLSDALTFYDDLYGTGQIDFDVVPKINVDGNIKFENINIAQLEALNATGNVSLDSNVSVKNIHANGDVEISNSTVETIKSKGTVTLGESSRADEIEADNNVYLYAGSDTMSVDSRADIIVGGNSGNHTVLTAGGGVQILNTTLITEGEAANYDGVIGTLNAVDVIDIDSLGATVNNIYGESDLECPPGAWTGYNYVELNGAQGNQCGPITADLEVAGQTNLVIPGSVDVNVIPPVPEYAVPPLRIDVFPLKGDANYIIEREGNKTKVTVNNINGDANGSEYYLGRHKGEGSKTDALCADVDDSGNCVCPDTSAAGCGTYERYICLGDSVHNHCVTYSNGTFTLEGTGIAPGIWWVDGDVVVQNGYNNATLLVTGNITSGGQYRGAAVNYGAEPIIYNVADRNADARISPYEQICQARAFGLEERAAHLIGDYRARFQQRYPTNLCDIANETYLPILTGNIALAAGGIRPDEEGGDGTTYSGGDIKIGANSQVLGMTLAGGYLEAGDATTFFGYVTAAVQGARRADGEVKNVLDGYAKLILDTASDFYSPKEAGFMGEPPPCHVGCAPPAGSGVRTRMLWSKYL